MFTVLAVSFQMSLAVDAVDVEITKVTAQTAQAFFGDTIPATVDGTSIQFEYYNSFSSPVVGLNVDTSSIISTPSDMEIYDFVVYRWLSTSGNTLHYNSVVFDDFYLRFGDYARGGFALSCRLSDGIQSRINNAISYPDNYCGSFPAVRANASASANLADYYGTMYFTPNSNNLNFRPVYYSFDSGGVLDSLQFQSIDNYNSAGNTDLYFIIICPYIGSSMSAQPPFTTTTAETTTGINVNVDVNVDMSETNGLLDQIKQGISGIAQSILDGLKNLFIPDGAFLQQFSADMDNLAKGHLGGLYQAEALLVDMFEGFGAVTAKEEIYIPPVSIPLAGENLILGDWHIPLKVAGLPLILYEGIAFIVDFLAIMAFLAMCRNKVEVFLVPESEEIR